MAAIKQVASSPTISGYPSDNGDTTLRDNFALRERKSQVARTFVCDSECDGDLNPNTRPLLPKLYGELNPTHMVKIIRHCG